MRKYILIAATVGALFAALAVSNQASAMTTTAPAGLATAANEVNAVEHVWYRRYWGYRPYWGYRRHYWSYYRPYWGYRRWSYYRPYAYRRHYWSYYRPAYWSYPYSGWGYGWLLSALLGLGLGWRLGLGRRLGLAALVVVNQSPKRERS